MSTYDIMCVSETETGRKVEEVGKKIEREREGGGGGGRERDSHSPRQLLYHRSLAWCIPEKQTPPTLSTIPGTVQTWNNSSERAETQTMTIKTTKCVQINPAKRV